MWWNPSCHLFIETHINFRNIWLGEVNLSVNDWVKDWGGHETWREFNSLLASIGFVSELIACALPSLRGETPVSVSLTLMLSLSPHSAKLNSRALIPLLSYTESCNSCSLVTVTSDWGGGSCSIGVTVECYCSLETMDFYTCSFFICKSLGHTPCSS